MANATVTRIGQINGAGDVDALFLKVYAGEVLTAFAKTQVMADKHMVRSISSGKSASFPVSGNTTASYHTPGTEITGKTMNHGEKIITIDDLLISDAFIANIDEAKNHYDVRSIYTTQMGEALAQTYDKNVLQVAILAARAAATLTGGNGGSKLVNANYATDSATLASGIYAAAQTMDEKDIPESERYAVFKPAQYYLLAQNTNLINQEWGGAGSYSDGKVIRIAGIPIVKSNNLPAALVNTGPTAYQGDFTNTRGLVFHKSAAGTVKLMDLGMESAYDLRRQGTLMVAKYAVGHGILRPESAVELAIA